MPFLSQRAADGFTSFVRAVLSVIAVPVREAHLIIGHSTVTAALLISLTLFGSCWLWISGKADLQAPAYQALQREREARAAVYEQQAAEAGYQAPSQVWTMADLSVSDTAVTFGYIPLAGAKWLIISWTVQDSSGAIAGTGIGRYDIPPPGADGAPSLHEVAIARETIGNAWVTGSTIAVAAEQHFADGVRARYTGREAAGTLP